MISRPDDIEHCCGAICDSARKQAYIEQLEAKNQSQQAKIKRLEKGVDLLSETLSALREPS